MPKGDGMKAKMKTDPNEMGAIAFGLKLTKWKNVQRIDVFDPEQCRERIEEFFMLCIQENHRPVMGELATALGISRENLSRIIHQNNYAGSMYARLPKECVDAMVDGYNIIRNAVESNLASGTGNPIAQIFLAKNLGLKDYNDDVGGTVREQVDLERLKTQYLNQLTQKEDPD